MPPAGFKQVFIDNFNGSVIDNTQWTVSNGIASDGLGTFQSSVGVVASGQLAMSVTGPSNYYSFRMTSVKPWPVNTYFEVYCQLPVETLAGPWVAPLWLWADDYTHNPNNQYYQEIDIEPHNPAGQPTDFWNTIFQTAPGKVQNSYTTGGNPWDGLWHTYGLLWEPTQITFFKDSIQQFQAPNPFGHTPNRVMQIRVDAKIGGFGGTPDAGLSYPIITRIDYIAVYQKLRSPVSTLK